MKKKSFPQLFLSETKIEYYFEKKSLSRLPYHLWKCNTIFVTHKSSTETKDFAKFPKTGEYSGKERKICPTLLFLSEM